MLLFYGIYKRPSSGPQVTRISQAHLNLRKTFWNNNFFVHLKTIAFWWYALFFILLCVFFLLLIEFETPYMGCYWSTIEKHEKCLPFKLFKLVVLFLYSKWSLAKSNCTTYLKINSWQVCFIILCQSYLK